MGEHIDSRSHSKKKKLKEHDQNARQARVTFKRYLRELDEDFLEAEIEIAEEPEVDQDE